MRMMEGLAAAGADPKTVVIDATSLMPLPAPQPQCDQCSAASMNGDASLNEWRRVCALYNRCPADLFAGAALAVAVISSL